jgi:hypothetical protein
MKKRILIIFYALLLCVTASFAWLSNFQANYVDEYISVDFRDGALSVVNLDFDAHIETPDADGTFTEIPEGTFAFDKRQMVPDSITPFKIKIKNNSETAERKAKLGVAIRIDPTENVDFNILDVLYLDVVAGSGFKDGNNHHVFVKLSTASRVGASDSGEYFLWIYGDGKEIVIPPTTAENEYVTLDCSFYYDQNATAEYQNKSIQAMAFRIE